MLLNLFVLVFVMFFVLVFALLVKLNFYCYYFFVRAQIIFCLLSLRQEFGKRILRGAAFLLETVGFDCKEVVCFFIAEKTLCEDALFVSFSYISSKDGYS